MKELIIIKQLPIIEEQLKSISDEIDKKLESINELVCNEDTVKSVKTTRAEFNKEFKDFEEKRKEVKTKVLAPYEQFEQVYKQYIADKYKNADITLKNKIDEVESNLKEEKTTKIKEYFNEVNKFDFITLEKVGLNITLSVSEKSLKEEVDKYINKIQSEVDLINTQDDVLEIMYEYQKTLNVALAINTVKDRKKVLEKKEEVKEEIKEIEKVNEEIITVEFKVISISSKIRMLRAYMDSQNIKYE